MVFMGKHLYMLQEYPGLEKEIIFSVLQQAMHIPRVSKEWKTKRQEKDTKKNVFYHHLASNSKSEIQFHLHI